MENYQMNNLSSEQMFQQYLSPDERIIWSGQPKSKLYMCTYDYLLALFEVGGLVFIAFFLRDFFSLPSMPSASMPFNLVFNLAFMVVPVIMCISVIYMLFFRPLKRHNKLKNTYYAVTNLRILEIQPNKGIFLESKIESLPGLSIRDESKPTGTLIFATQNDSSSIYTVIISGIGKQIIPTNRPVAFVNIPDVQSVCDIIKSVSTQPLEIKPISLMSSGNYQEEIDLSKEPVQSSSEELYFPSSPAPRYIPLNTIIALLIGNAGAQFGWVFFGFGMIFFWVFAMPILMPRGYASSPFDWSELFVVIFPLFGLLLIVSTIVIGIKKIGLLKNGRLVPAQLKSMSKIVSSNEGSQSVSYKMIFTYTASDGKIYETNTIEMDPEPLRDQKLEPLLYNPDKPSSAVLLDSIPGEPRLDSFGNIVNKKPISAIKMLCSLIIPLIAILGHGYYVYITFIK